MSDRRYGWHPARPMLWAGDGVYEWHADSRYLERIKGVEWEHDEWRNATFGQWSCNWVGGTVPVVVLHESDRAQMAREAATTQTQFCGFAIGTVIAIRALPFHYLGRLDRVAHDHIRLTDASWLASSGRWSEFCRAGTLSEAEPYAGPVSVRCDVVADVSAWPHDLPDRAIG